MGLAGTDIAVKTADIALANDNLQRLLDVPDLGARAVKVIRQNYGMSIAVNSVGLLMGAGGTLSQYWRRSCTTPPRWRSSPTAPG